MKLARVLLEVKVPAEPLAAHLARVRFLVIVRVHVEGQVVDLVKSFVADGALVGLLTRVREPVVLVVPFLVETLAAVFAHPGLEARMDSNVRVKRRTAVERFAARGALVRLLLRVNDLVSTQGARLPEALAANLADEGPSARVNGHVPCQVIVCVEYLSALYTRECLWFAVLLVQVCLGLLETLADRRGQPRLRTYEPRLYMRRGKHRKRRKTLGGLVQPGVHQTGALL